MRGSCRPSTPSRLCGARPSCVHRRPQGLWAIWSFRIGGRAQGFNGLSEVRGAMVRLQVIAYTPADFLEEPDTTIGRCRELVEKYAVTWVNVVDPDERTLDELETLFGFHPLALEDAQNQDLHPKVEVYDDTVFVVVRTIVWTEEIETDQLSIFLGRKFVVTIHDKVFPQLEDIRIRLRKKTPRLLKAGADFLAYTILDVLVDSYFPHLDRFQSLLDQLEEQIVARPTGTGIAHLNDVRTDVVRLRNDLRPQRDIFGVLSRLEVPLFRKEMRNYLREDRKSTRLNSSHLGTSYAVFCLKKKNPLEPRHPHLRC